jgi:hypothetical protein
MATVNEIYNSIGLNIRESISEEWDKAQLNIEVLKGYTSYNGFYFNNQNERRSLKVSKFSDGLNDDLLLLHEIIA